MASELNANKFGELNARTVHLQHWFEVTVAGEPDLTFSVQSCPFFTEGNEAVELHYGNSKVYQAGKATYEGGSWTFVDLMGVQSRLKLAAWRKQCYNAETGVIGWQESYKRDMKVHLYGPDGIILSTWRMVGCWPSNVNWGNLDYSATDKSNVEVTITFDYAINPVGNSLADIATGVMSSVSSIAANLA